MQLQYIISEMNEEQFLCCAIRGWDVKYYQSIVEHNAIQQSLVWIVWENVFACASMIGSIDPVHEL